MRFHEFISDRLGKIILQFSIMTLVSFTLLSTGTQPGIVALLLVILFLIRMTVFVIDFIKCRSHLNELESIMDGLDQKYLFAECIPKPRTVYEQHLFTLIRRSCKSMIEAVTDAQSTQREYREYIESWVHEIKSPITAAELICYGIDAESGRRLTPELDQIKAHVERALFYARAESPEKDFIIRQVNLSEIVASTIESYRSLLMQSGICIETGNLDYLIYTDDKWTCFILGQLLQNAARYKKTSTAQLQDYEAIPMKSCASEPPCSEPEVCPDVPIISITAGFSKRRLVLTVSDNGIGIPAHELPRVCERGFTGSNGRARGGSTGMGLYLCRRLSKLLEIDMQITSVKHQGTQVMLAFPVKEILQKCKENR